MKIIHKNNKEGIIKVEADAVEDLWHLSQIIEEGDSVEGRTFRKIVYGEKSERKPCFISIKVKRVKLEKDVLRILGVITESSNEDISKGEHHSFNVEKGSTITITKESWSRLAKERILQAVSESKKPKLYLVIAERGHADFFILSSVKLEKAGSIDVSIGGKVYKTKEKLEDFFDELIEKLINVETETIVFAGDGFTAEDFSEYLKEKKHPLLKKMVFGKVNSIGRTGANELLKSGQLEKLFNSQRIAVETKMVEEILKRISLNEKIAYGMKETEEKIFGGAVEQLVISDKLMMEKREKIEGLIKTAEKSGSRIFIVSSSHESGRKFYKIGGIAGILRY